MKLRIISILAIAFLLTVALGAQTTSPTASVQSQARGPADIAGLLYAANFAHWTASPTDMGTRWTSPGQCYGTSGGLVFPLFSTKAPIKIVDVGNPAFTETVTPTLASYNAGGCSVALPATHPHSNYYLVSGTFGLQEAMNWIGAGFAQIILTPDWQAMGGTTAMITASVPGSVNTSINDTRTALETAYFWNGSVWVVGSTVVNFAGVPSGNCAVGTLATNTAAASASTVLYVCAPANTWTAVAVP